MNKTVLCLILLLFVSGTLTCDTNQVYVKLLKTHTIFPNKERIRIVSGETVFVSAGYSPEFSGTSWTGEFCLNATPNYQYTLQLIDIYSIGWAEGSHLQIQGEYGNYFFDGMQRDLDELDFNLSLYYPIHKAAQWKLTSGSITGSWKEYDFDDSAWSTVQINDVDIPVSGNHYFRKTFTGLDGMAGYELSLHYRFGIVAYINGVEVYRDNMPDGPVTPDTKASNSYIVSDDHAIIRPGVEVSQTSSVLAVEIHFIQLPQTFVDFDAYMALYTPSIENTDCMVYPAPHSLTDAEGSATVSRAWDYSYNTAFDISTLPKVLSYHFLGASPYINMLTVYPQNNPSKAPKSFIWEGVKSSTTTPVISVEDASYTDNQLFYFNGFFNAGIYDHYNLRVTDAKAIPMTLYEVQPCICHAKVPTGLTFSQESYTYYAFAQTVSIKPIFSDFSNCVITPTPAAGLSFDPVTCTLSGVATTGGSFTHTVTSTMNGQQYIGTFSLEIVNCQDHLVRALRTYQESPQSEYFTITDLSTNATLLSVEKYSGQPPTTDVEFFFCTASPKIEVETFTSSTYWKINSDLYLYYVIDQDNEETLLRTHRDNNYGYPSSHIVSLNYVIPPHSSWHYKMGTVPANWYTIQTGTSGWDTKPASGYPDSTNQIQLYKTTFNVASVTDIAGAVLSLKYQYGVIVYINDHEIFRKGVSGELSTSSVSSTSLSSVKFRQISFPISGSYRSGSFSNFIVVGSNTISIALVSSGASVKTSTFDAALRLMGDSTVIRNHDYTVTVIGDEISSACENVFLNHDNPLCTQFACASQSIEITFNDDRHEWLSSVALKSSSIQSSDWVGSFVFQGKNAEDSTWTTIKQYSGLTWSQRGQRNRYWTLSTEAYNQYRFTNITGVKSNECRWRFNSIELIRDSISASIPDLSYEDTTIFKLIEMAELYPNTDLYTDFYVTPALPEGIVMDPITGMISGTTSVTQELTTYSVTAKKYSGEPSSCTFQFGVSVCTGGKSLITAVIRTDNWPSEIKYKLFKGKGIEGEELINVSGLPVKNALYYIDECLNDDIYTYEFSDNSDGWDAPAGFYLSVDVGEMKFAAGQVPRKNVAGGIWPTVSFSSYLPFQVEYSDWKVYKSTEDVASNWNAIDFDDSTWTVTKATQIGTSEAVTVYIRHDVTLDDVSKYNVLNVRVKYAGGVVAYFNGHKVARFNLPDEFDSETESLHIHDSTASSKFHVVLSLNGAVTGKNVMAFEIHRPVDTTSIIPVAFDATGMLDPNDCSYALDSYSTVAGTALSDDNSLSIFFDMDPSTLGQQTNAVGTYLEWTVENLEGTRFNTLGVGSSSAVNSWGFSLYGRDESTESYTTIHDETEAQLTQRMMITFDAMIASVGFNQYKLEYTAKANSGPQVFDYIQFYCPVTGANICSAQDGYPAVAEGSISPGECEYGFSGYAYRECSNGVLGEVKTEHCTLKAPSAITYGSLSFTLVKDTEIHIAGPTYRYIVEKFSLAEETQLPKGLTLDSTTGAIDGIPEEEMEPTVFTIIGENRQGQAEVTMTIIIRKGECKADGNFPRTVIGETAVFECSSQGSYIGTQKRACVLGAKDGEWEAIDGVCVSVVLIVVVVILVVIVIGVVIYFVVKCNKKKVKAVGGVKGKKAVKKLEKKEVS